MNITEQTPLVLKVLTAMKDCLDNDTTFTTIGGESFNLSRQCGICWHVYAHTPSSNITEIDYEFLKPAFVSMGLDVQFPVEKQLVSTEKEASHLYALQHNLYAMDSEPGPLRRKLLCDLIKYFENVVATSEVL